MPPKKKTLKKKKKTTASGLLKTVDNESLLPPIRTSTNDSTLQFAVSTGDVSSLSRLVTHYNFSSSLQGCDNNGSTPLHQAAQRGDEKMVEQLLSYPQTIAIINSHEKTTIGGYAAIHLAASAGHVEILTKLIKAGALLNIKSHSQLGETPLLCAVKFGRKECAKELIAAGARLDARDNFGHNASFWASQRGHMDLIKELQLPSPKTATADEYIAILMAANKNFALPSLKKKASKGDSKGKGKGKKK